MFIYSIRANTIKLVGIILLALVLMGTVVLTGSGEAVAVSASGSVDYSGIKTKEDRIAFIESFGLKVDADSEQESAFTMPENFDRVILGYNELQKKQGLDLSKYKNKKVTRFTYKLVDYKDSAEAYATLFIYRGKIVACDVASLDPNGFVLPLTFAEGK